MQIRRYTPGDLEVVTRLFYETIHSVNLRDYTPAQADAWAPKAPDLDRWGRILLAHDTFVAKAGGVIAGFGDIDSTGYLDHLFIHRDYQRRGIAAALCDRLEALYPSGPVITHASLTARGFFEKRGYRVIREQRIVRSGVELTNFVMEKP